MDISVHCDIKIFDWLMCWIKHDNFMEKPSLDTPSVVSILVSASFLQVKVRGCFSQRGGSLYLPARYLSW